MVIYQLIFGQYFLSPAHLLCNFPEQELYGATPLGRPLLQKALGKGRTPANARDGGTWVRMETAADFIRGYEGRRWFSKLFADDPAFFAAYSEITGACIIKLTAAEEDEEIPSAEPEQNRSAEEKEKSALTEELQSQYQEDILGMLAAGKTYCATAYLETLARRYPEYQPFRMQLAYALNDPMADCAYSSDKLFQVYFSGNSEPIDALVVSAALRSCFFNQCGYDYQLDQLWDAVAKRPLLEANVALNQVLYQLKEFKSTYHRGIDFYADYRQKKREAFEQSLSAVRAEAQSLYQNNVLGRTKERASQKRFLETKKLIFSPQGELAEYLDAVRRCHRQ